MCALEREWALQYSKGFLARPAHVVAFVARSMCDASGARNGVGQTKRLCCALGCNRSFDASVMSAFHDLGFCFDFGSHPVG